MFETNPRIRPGCQSSDPMSLRAATERRVRRRGGHRLPAAGVAALLVAMLTFGFAPAVAQDPGLTLLERELVRIGELSGGVMGFSAIHLESGREVHLNPDEAFPMASSYKVPIAVKLFQRVDRGELNLEDMITLEPHHYSPGSGTLTDLFIQPGVSLSLRNLTELMMLISDNTATDLVLAAAGGGVAVTDAMRSLGYPGVRVDRPTLNLIADFIGIEGLPPREQLTVEGYRAFVEATPPEVREAAARTFHLDPRDTAKPREMAALLSGIWEDRVLSPEMSALLRDIMERCRTGENRIRGMLPSYVTTANKTGTIGGSLNDVGVIVLPEGRGHVVVAAFVRESSAPNPRREAAIAHASRAVYDYFNMNP
jgi:beta-lactamase class A